MHRCGYREVSARSVGLTAVQSGGGWSGAQGVVVDFRARLHVALRWEARARRWQRVPKRSPQRPWGPRLACCARDGGAVGGVGSARAGDRGLEGEAVGAAVRAATGMVSGDAVAHSGCWRCGKVWFRGRGRARICSSRAVSWTLWSRTAAVVMAPPLSRATGGSRSGLGDRHSSGRRPRRDPRPRRGRRGRRASGCLQV